MSWANEITVADAGFHPRNDDPWWNESSFITFRIPERRILGILYFYFRPNQNMVMGGPIFFDSSGDELSTCLHNGWGWHLPMPAGTDMFDFRLASGFAIQTFERQRHYCLTYEAAGCEFKLDYIADQPPYVMPSSGKSANQGLADFVGQVKEEVTTGHYEQIGFVSGSLILNGETIEVRDAPALQDRSWGPRPLIQSQNKSRGALVFARSISGSAFQAWAVSESPWEQDPVDGTNDRIVSGFLLREGVRAPLVSGTRRVVERGGDGRPCREIVEATDALGRHLNAEGEIKATLKWPGVYGDIMSFWCYEEWSFDQCTASPGELQEWMMCRHYRSWRQASCRVK